MHSWVLKLSTANPLGFTLIEFKHVWVYTRLGLYGFGLTTRLGLHAFC